MDREIVQSEKTILFYLFFLLIGLVLIDKSIQKKKTVAAPTEIVSEVIETSVNESKLVEDSADIFANEETLQGIYFIKFYHVNQNSRSKLVKVQRKLSGSLKKRIKTALSELKKGPNSSELGKGVLTSLPSQFSYDKKLKLIDGVLHISLDSNFENKASKELLQDRIDQLTHTLFEFSEIKGIKMYIEGVEINSIGKNKIAMPNIISKATQRKIVFL